MRGKARYLTVIRVLREEGTTKAKCKCTYHVLRRARSQIFGYSKLNEMESQRNIGHKVGRKKVYIRAVFYFEPLERLIKRK